MALGDIMEYGTQGQPQVPAQVPVQQNMPQMDDVKKTQAAELFMQAAQQAAMAGLNQHADNYLAIAKTLTNANGKPAKPFQANNLYDMFAVQSSAKHGADITTPEGYNRFVRWAGTEEGVKEWKAYMARQAKGETFKEQYVGPSSDHPGYDIWTKYDEFGKGQTELRPSAGIALPRNIGRTPATEMNRGIALDTIKGNIDRIKQTYNPEYVGPVAGRAFSVKEATVGLPERQSMFYADTRDIADMLLRARSGAQINEQEYQRLSKLVPNPNLPPATFEARLKRFEEQLSQIYQAQSNRLRSGNYLPGPGMPSKTVPLNKPVKNDMDGFWK